jgi:hypothetical protein
MDQVRIRSMLRSPTGPVGRKILAKGKQIEVRAKELAAPHGTMANYVHSSPLPSLLGTTVLIYCDHPAAIFVLKPTKPHAIDSHGTWPLRNKRTGQVFGRHVWHPGYKGDDFLGRAMREAGPL